MISLSSGCNLNCRTTPWCDKFHWQSQYSPKSTETCNVLTQLQHATATYWLFWQYLCSPSPAGAMGFVSLPTVTPNLGMGWALAKDPHPWTTLQSTQARNLSPPQSFPWQTFPSHTTCRATGFVFLLILTLGVAWSLANDLQLRPTWMI